MNPLIKTYIFAFTPPSGASKFVKVCPQDRYDQSRIDHILDQSRNVSDFCKCVSWFDSSSEHYTFDIPEIPMFEFLHDIVSSDRNRLVYDRHEADAFNREDLASYANLFPDSIIGNTNEPVPVPKTDQVSHNPDTVQHILLNLGFRKSSIVEVIQSLPSGLNTPEAIKFCCQRLGGHHE